jgi:hypothetical protein
MSRKSSRRLFVIQADGHVSFDAEGNPQSFGSEASAARRARELAQCEPGKPVFIARAIHCAVAPTGPVTINGVSK